MSIKYEYGLHCGDKDCYSCGTQRYVCKDLELLDNKTDMEMDELDNDSMGDLLNQMDDNS